MASRAAARVTKNRFALPLDHRATRPGFQAPWASIDPAQEVRQSSRPNGRSRRIFVSWGLFALTRRDNGTRLFLNGNVGRYLLIPPPRPSFSPQAPRVRQEQGVGHRYGGEARQEPWCLKFVPFSAHPLQIQVHFCNGFLPWACADGILYGRWVLNIRFVSRLVRQCCALAEIMRRRANYCCLKLRDRKVTVRLEEPWYASSSSIPLFAGNKKWKLRVSGFQCNYYPIGSFPDPHGGYQSMLCWPWHNWPE